MADIPERATEPDVRARMRADARVARWKERVEESRRQLSEVKRAVLAPEALRAILPARAAAVRHRAADPSAAARHQQWAARSSAYASAVGAYERGMTADASPVTLGGLRWWVPHEARQPDRPGRFAAQGLPLRAILNAREFAVGDVMLDLGANLGRTSLTRVALGDVRTVYAAEPDPSNYRALVYSVLDNRLAGLVVPDCIAIAGATETRRLARSRFAGGHALTRSPHRYAEDATIDVAVWRLDEWVHRLQIDAADICFVKVDVQGWECDVLRGAGDLLTAGQIAWQLEIDPSRLARARSNVASLAALVESRFDRFVDTYRMAEGPRHRPIAELRESLGYLGGQADKTDVIVYHDSRSDGDEPPIARE